MLAAPPRSESRLAYAAALAGLHAHRAWRRYFALRPLLAYPLERAARAVYDVTAHYARKWHDPLYAQLRGDEIVASGVPQREPESWRAAVVQVLVDAQKLVAVLLALRVARRALTAMVDRRAAELAPRAEPDAAADDAQAPAPDAAAAGGAQLAPVAPAAGAGGTDVGQRDASAGISNAAAAGSGGFEGAGDVHDRAAG
jgi:hypothetical protein